MLYFLPPPKSLRDVGDMVVTHGIGYASSMKEFIDTLIEDLQKKGARTGDAVLPIDPSVFQDEPAKLDRDIHRVHLAAMAEYLANLSSNRPPEWCLRPEFFLDDPIFMGGSNSWERSIVETPAAFRKRLLFTGQVLMKLWTMLSVERSQGLRQSP